MTLRECLAGPGGDVLSLMRLQGGGFGNQGRQRTLTALQASAQAGDKLREELVGRRRAGWRAMVTFGGAPLLAALRATPGDALPLPLPVVPNLQGFMREAVEHGMAGAAMRRAWRVGPLALAGLGLRGIGRLPALLVRRDFPTQLRCFIELELADFHRIAPPLVFLHAQMTDLALAMDNPRIVEAFSEAVRRRLGAAVGLISYNPGRLLDALRRWGLGVDALIVSADRPGGDFLPFGGEPRRFDGPVWGIRRQWIEGPAGEDRNRQTAGGMTGWLREDAAAWTADISPPAGADG